MGTVLPINGADPDRSLLSFVAGAIQKGGVVAFPTDTFYGLAVDPFNPAAVDRLFKIKRRDTSKPILLLIARLEMLYPLVREVPPLAEKIIRRFWPGPLTLIFEAAPSLPDLLTAGTGKIGIRLPKAILPIRLIEAVGLPITATSANVSGGGSPISASDVEKGLSVDHILDGGTCSMTPSTVLDMTTTPPRILREGKISADLLAPFIGEAAGRRRPGA